MLSIPAGFLSHASCSGWCHHRQSREDVGCESLRCIDCPLSPVTQSKSAHQLQASRGRCVAGHRSLLVYPFPAIHRSGREPLYCCLDGKQPAADSSQTGLPSSVPTPRFWFVLKDQKVWMCVKPGQRSVREALSLLCPSSWAQLDTDVRR